MTGAETAGGGMDCNRSDSKDRPLDPALVDSPFRAYIRARIRTWRSLRHPTVEQIEGAQFWERYLAAPAPVPRALQEKPVEPIQER